MHTKPLPASAPHQAVPLDGEPPAYRDILPWLLAGASRFLAAAAVHKGQPMADPAQSPERMALHGYRWLWSDPVLRHHHKGA